MNTTSKDNLVHPMLNVEINDTHGDSLFLIIHILFQVVIFFVGLFIQVKIISVCKKERGTTWKIHVSHAVVTSVYYAHFIAFKAITYFVPCLSQHTGTWTCYVASLITFYGFQSIISNTLVISTMKYLFVVHGTKAMAFGGEKIKKYFFWANLITPLILGITAVLTTDYETRSELKSCFGKTEVEVPQHHNIISSFDSRTVFYTCAYNRMKNYSGMTFYALQFACIFRKTVNVVTGINLAEAFFYYKIFHFMKT